MAKAARKGKSKKRVNGVERKTARKPRQQRLAGMEDAAIEAIETAAEEYLDARDVWSAAAKTRGDRMKELLAAMRKNGKSIYRHGDLEIVTKSAGDKLTVKKLKTAPVEDAEFDPDATRETEGAEATA